ncbi:MAG: deoxyribonuclease IV [Planctomycetaceae bacterium]|nr:deoxyribonuclease IV [Planctomycetaceae bacterium]
MQRLLGAHMSIAGGYYKAVDAAAALGMTTVQLFTKNNNQWRAKPLSDDDIRLFRDALDRTGVQRPCAHDSYLINLASPDDALWNKSIDAFEEELRRAEALGLCGVVMHPGSCLDSGEECGLKKIVQALDICCQRTKGFATEVWLEITAGQGSNLGYRFEHLQYIIEHVQEPQRYGVCLDTCHLLAAGYPLGTDDEFESTVRQLDATIGLKRVRALHLNDSKKDLGSRVDRHEHIGEGKVGLEPFRRILNDPRFNHLPMYLETKKEQRNGEEMDAVNLRTLRSLIADEKADSGKPKAAKKAPKQRKPQ